MSGVLGGCRRLWPGRGIHATSFPRSLTSKWAARQRFLSTYSGNSKGVGEFTYPHPCRFSALQIYSASLALSSSPIFCCCSPPPERVPQLPWGIFKDSELYVLRTPPADIIVFPDGEGRQSHSSHLPRHLCPDLAVRVVPQIAVILYISANGK